MNCKWRSLGLSGVFCLTLIATSKAFAVETIFVEAESMAPSSAGWRALSNDQSRRASRVRTLWGADGPGDAIATKNVQLQTGGKYRVWVRYLQVGAWRGPFEVSVNVQGKSLASSVFDKEVIRGVVDWDYTWQGFDTDLPPGEYTLVVSKFEKKNCTGYVRHVDCLIVTNDTDLVPDHQPYGPQTLVRVSIGEGYDRPVYMHLFAAHYRDPWYAHYALGKDGLHRNLAPPAGQLLKSGEVTPWCNLTPTIYQDSGAALNFSIRYSYHEKAARLRAKLEFARVESGVAFATGTEPTPVKTFDVVADPNGLVVIAPPDLESAVNVSRLKRDREFAEEVGQIADAFPWPAHGRRPTKIPFLVTANIGGYELPVDRAVMEREEKTLDYFGFNGTSKSVLGGLWYMQGGSYCRPDLDAMRRHARHGLELFQKSGRRVEDIPFCMLMDEPTGQPTGFMVQDTGYQERFREWLKKKLLQPADVKLTQWGDVRPVLESDRTRFPELHYYTQLFKTRALGDFLSTQRRIIEETYGRSFPTLVNFSDGAVYHANFCGQGVDYFELLDADDQNAIWGEDWANNSSTYQCAAFNVALMQSAARKRNQTVGHYLIAHAHRTPWDIKTKAVSETARGVRMWKNFSYGPNWSSHEGGQAWHSHLWYGRPELWRANAEITREIGAVEDWLQTARPARADVALLYSSASDIWTMQSNLAFGFDRMHTWLALTHSQTPVDIIPEREIEQLDDYKVCYLSGPNLTRSAATKLRAWVAAGGVLWLSAGAAQRDEFDRPLDLLGDLVQVKWGEIIQPEPYFSAGKFLSYLNPLDTVNWNGDNLDVLSVKQALKVTASTGANSAQSVNGPQTLAVFKDGHPAVVSSVAGTGRVFMLGFLPGLSYIRPALLSRRPLEQQAAADRAATEELAAAADQPLATSGVVAIPATGTEQGTSVGELVKRSHNPWMYPAHIRSRLLSPVDAAKVVSDLTCDIPLVDAVALSCDQGTLIALSNHTLRPLEAVQLRWKTVVPVTRIESVRSGELRPESFTAGELQFKLPLEATDFVLLHHKR